MRLRFTGAAQVISFVQQNHRSLDIIRRAIEKIWIERDDLEGEIGGRVSLPMPDPAIPPIVSHAKVDQTAQQKSVAAEALLIEHINCAVDDRPLFGSERIGSQREREVGHQQ